MSAFGPIYRGWLIPRAFLWSVTLLSCPEPVIRLRRFNLACDSVTAYERRMRILIVEDGSTWPTLSQAAEEVSYAIDSVFDEQRRTSSSARALRPGGARPSAARFQWPVSLRSLRAREARTPVLVLTDAPRSTTSEHARPRCGRLQTKPFDLREFGSLPALLPRPQGMPRVG